MKNRIFRLDCETGHAKNVIQMGGYFTPSDEVALPVSVFETLPEKAYPLGKRLYSGSNNNVVQPAATG